MASYSILSSARPGQPDADALVIGDRFSLFAFLFGGLWFFWHGVWFVGVLLILADLALAFAAYSTGNWLLAYVCDLALALLVGLEAGNWRLEAALGKGYRVVDIVEADNAETAFARHAFRLVSKGGTQSPGRLPPLLPGERRAPLQTRTSAQTMVGLVPSDRRS